MAYVKVQDLLHEFTPPPRQYVLSSGRTSRKTWVEDFPPFHVRYVTPWNPDIPSIETFLGPGATPNVTFGAEALGLDTPAHPLNELPQLASSEGDVTRDFEQNILPPVSLAFSGRRAPKLWSRSQVAAMPSLNETSKTVDFQLTMFHTERYLEKPAAIGEFKKYGAIKSSEWRYQARMSTSTARLQSEIRGYVFFVDSFIYLAHRGKGTPLNTNVLKFFSLTRATWLLCNFGLQALRIFRGKTVLWISALFPESGKTYCTNALYNTHYGDFPGGVSYDLVEH